MGMASVVKLVKGTHSAGNSLDCGAGIIDDICTDGCFLGGVATEREHHSTEEAYCSTLLFGGDGRGRGGGAITCFLRRKEGEEIYGFVSGLMVASPGSSVSLCLGRMGRVVTYGTVRGQVRGCLRSEGCVIGVDGGEIGGGRAWS